MTRHRFHGDPARFEVVGRFIADRFPDARYVADVAGGQGMLTRILRKRFGFEAEVIDPRGWALRGCRPGPSFIPRRWRTTTTWSSACTLTKLSGALSSLRERWLCWSCRVVISGLATAGWDVMS